MQSGLVAVCFFFFGLIIGSFLNVVVYRLHTGKTLGGRSRCLSCGHALSWKDLFPLASYIALRGRCRYCRARISPRYMAVELLSGALFALVALVFPEWPLRVVYCALMAALVVILVYDLVHTIIPDEFVLLTAVVAGGIALIFPLMGYVSLSVVSHSLGAAAGFLFFGALWLVSRGRWLGLGDAKLAIPLGFLVGWPGVVSMVVLSFWIGAVVSVVMLAVQRLALATHGSARHREHDGSTGFLRKVFHLPRIRLTMKSEIPFAPFLIAAFLAVHLFSIDVFAFFSTVL